MAKKIHRTPQPAIDRDSRSTETRTVWLGGVLALLAVGVALAGLLHLRPVVGDGVETISEYELIHAATVGGIVQAETADAGKADDAATQPATTQPRPKIKKTKAQDYCPT